ncbi:MAG: FAD-dependent monooxygenase [Pseudonocardia sp.]|nr:FAD-dependent monooxygenase [Pseudonocardia sp.]
MAEHAVVVAGAGPTGLMLAGELALGGVDVAIVERRHSSDELIGSRAGGMTSRTLEVLDQRGIADRFLSQGWQGQIGTIPGCCWISATCPRGTTTGWGCPSTASSARWPTGSPSWGCRSIAAGR